jgi:hypothetical protein
MNVKTIFTKAHIPEELAQAWLQHLRDFDTAHPGCHFEVGVDGPEASIADMIKMTRVEPGLTFAKIWQRAGTKWTPGDEP